jgi:hypothetical protein
MIALMNRQARDPMDVVEDAAQRALLAEVLLAEVKPPEESEIRSAIQEIQERAIKAQLRDLRTLLEAARDEGSPEWNALLLRQLELDRALRRLHQHQEPV